MFAVDRARKISTLAITCIGFFMVLLDASIVIVALPTIQRDLHAELTDLQWVVDSYTLLFAVLLLTAGTLSDRFGRKRLFLVGLAVFTFGSALCGFAPTLGWLIAGRVLQGVGGAFLSPGSLSVLASAFPDSRERAQAIGIWSGVSGLGIAAGPLIGGLLIQTSSWPAIFFVNVPIGIVALTLGWIMLVDSRNPQARRIDLPGLLLSIVALTVLTYALIEGSRVGWTSPLILTLFALFVLFFGAFLVVEARGHGGHEPLLPLSLFKNVIFSAANGAAVLVGFAFIGAVFFISQYFQGIQGNTALGSGLRTVPTTLGMFIGASLAGWLTARFSPRLPVTIGGLMAGSALLLLTQIEPNTLYNMMWWKFALFGLGIGLILSPLTVAILASTPPTQAGLASSMVNTSRQLGNVLGVALLGALVSSQFTSNIERNLIAAGILPAVANKIAHTIAGAGTQAGQGRLPGSLSISPQALHILLAQAFTDAIHVAFSIGSIALFCTAGLAFLFLGRVQRVDAIKEEAIVPQDAVSTAVLD